MPWPLSVVRVSTWLPPAQPGARPVPKARRIHCIVGAGSLAHGQLFAARRPSHVLSAQPPPLAQDACTMSHGHAGVKLLPRHWGPHPAGAGHQPSWQPGAGEGEGACAAPSHLGCRSQEGPCLASSAGPGGCGTRRTLRPHVAWSHPKWLRGQVPCPAVAGSSPCWPGKARTATGPLKARLSRGGSTQRAQGRRGHSSEGGGQAAGEPPEA